MAWPWQYTGGVARGGGLGACPEENFREQALYFVLEHCSRSNIYPYTKIEFLTVGSTIFIN